MLDVLQVPLEHGITTLCMSDEVIALSCDWLEKTASMMQTILDRRWAEWRLKAFSSQIGKWGDAVINFSFFSSPRVVNDQSGGSGI